MEKTYQPREIEAAIYEEWLKSNAFKTHLELHKTAYSIMLPPPNVTGSLHMGHAFQQTLMDILIRTHRMYGENVLWQAGVDHAGIATQMVVENQLFHEGKTRYDLGREAFVETVWTWKEKSGGAIMKQMRRLGASSDWSRERFTMDEGLSQAVQTAFITLYEDGLIERRKRLVNWDPHFKTAVSDLEVVHSEEQGFLYHIRYPVEGSDESVIIATTRPETLLGDMAVAVHPDDPRYQHLIGKHLILPLCQRTIPVIADTYVDQSFGTGCVKITPAHDFNDYEVGMRHELAPRSIFTLEGKINENAPSAYQGLERFTARKAILRDLEALSLLVDKKPHTLQIPRNERGNTILEPMLTDQWFVMMKPLATTAIKAVQDGDTVFTPSEWQNTYFRWLENIQDWCISRQLWWGHRIPAWYDSQGKAYVGENEAQVRKKYHLDASVELRQDEDVLDTWFSSALWPFSTLGWPKQTDELKHFYPTSVLVTGFDIIFFWVARMIMFGLYFTGKVPFKTVYVHGLIRDHEGQKMSKSKGNVLDPVDLIDGIDLESLLAKRSSHLMQESLKARVIKATQKQFPQGIQAFGTDALRFTFAAIAAPTRDIHFDVKRLEGYRNFCNKLWNAARFVMMQVEGLEWPIEAYPADSSESSAHQSNEIHESYKIKFNQAVSTAHTALQEYRFDTLAQNLYDFFWNDYCDWYLEFCKVILQDTHFSDEAKKRTRFALLNMLEHILRLLHPLIPFITEEIWQTIKKPLGINAASLINQTYPEAKQFKNMIIEFAEWLRAIVIEIRKIRSEKNIHPSTLLPVYYDFHTAKSIDPATALLYLSPLAKVESLSLIKEQNMKNAQSFFVGGKQFYLGNVVDLEVEKARIQKEIQKIGLDMEKLASKLENTEFISKAPQAVVEKEKTRLAELEARKAHFAKDLQFLG